MKDIADLSEYTIGEPYKVVIDIDPEKNQWYSGMITKFNNKDVMIIEALDRKEWRKVIDQNEGTITVQNRILFTLLIADL